MMTKTKNKVYSSFSKSLLYNQQNSTNIISVKNYPQDNICSTEIALKDLHVDDFYNKENNDAFLTYSRALVKDETGRIGCSIVFGSDDGQVKINIMRETLGALMEVLFCFEIVGIPMDNSAEDNPNDKKTVTLKTILSYFKKCIDKEIPDEDPKWNFLNNQIIEFNKFLIEERNLNEVSDYILDKLCIDI